MLCGVIWRTFLSEGTPLSPSVAVPPPNILIHGSNSLPGLGGEGWVHVIIFEGPPYMVSHGTEVKG